MKIKMTEISLKDAQSMFKRKRKTNSKFREAHIKIDSMEVGTVMKFSFDSPEPRFGQSLQQNYRNGRSNFRLKTRKEDYNGTSWLIYKLPRKKNRGNI